MGKAEMQKKKDHAFQLYVKGVTQKEIAERVGTTPVTVSKWVKSEAWEQRRAAENITRKELVNKLLVAINKLIDSVLLSEDVEVASSLPDKLAKFASAIKKLENEAGIVETVEVFMAFMSWLRFRLTFDEEVTPELIKLINKYQDLYVADLLEKQRN
jgi:transcriptional regulator with XRE-family HTH domain